MKTEQWKQALLQVWRELSEKERAEIGPALLETKDVSDIYNWPRWFLHRVDERAASAQEQAR